MEPQITDFYNEYPYGVNVIEKMNEECDFLLRELDKRDEEIKGLIELYKDLDRNIKEYKKEQELKEFSQQGIRKFFPESMFRSRELEQFKNL